ncbi:Musashi-like protein [Oopsacas minuta]|uniref:Musashi-like protein n=1 Tax=Oopsacas minuta TaxID=111878 RepID=A0AAV7K4X4_9METZ|nr:Musashi-like protein [Oopsacas minuta]
MSENSKHEAGKIFVGGLSWDTDKDSLINYFTEYGDVADGVIMVDSMTRLPRGFGFVTFKDPASVSKVTAVDTHYLDGKKIDPKEAITKDHHAASQHNKSSNIVKKVFVGGLPHGCTDEEIKFYFGQYGTVSEVDVKMDRQTSKPRGFAFVEYDDKLSAAKAIKDQFQNFKDKKIEVKAAENRMPGGPPSPASAPTSYQQWTNYQTAASGTSSQNPHTFPQYNNPYYYPYSAAGGSSYMAGGHPTYQPGSNYGTSHSSAQPNNYPSQQVSSYQPNGYQPNYSQSSYPTQGFSSAYGQQPYSSSTGGYPQYHSTFSGQSDTAHPVPYGQSQTTSNYYQNTSYTQAFPSDSRYSQPPNQRNY